MILLGEINSPQRQRLFCFFFWEGCTLRWPGMDLGERKYRYREIPRTGIRIVYKALDRGRGYRTLPDKRVIVYAESSWEYIHVIRGRGFKQVDDENVVRGLAKRNFYVRNYRAISLPNLRNRSLDTTRRSPIVQRHGTVVLHVIKQSSNSH